MGSVLATGSTSGREKLFDIGKGAKMMLVLIRVGVENDEKKWRARWCCGHAEAPHVLIKSLLS